ncbi:MAG TPA: ATP-binding protein [Anaeromyxobacter sp.]|nr:ATP-binding protein [Anaeromyxobacter sp.]
MAELAGPAAIVTAYMALLVAVAAWAERREAAGRSVAANRLVYSLSLAVYATTWSFYGSVGFAARHGLLFLSVYLGPTLCAALWWWVLRKLVRLKELHGVTSLADLLALRFGKSQAVALVATIVLVVGLVPYVAAQLKSMIVTLSVVAGGLAYPAAGARLGAPLVAFMLLFTIVFGLRRVRPTERHPGLVVALAVECVVKLVTFLAAGAFVVFGLFDGPLDVFRAAAAPGVPAPAPLGNHGVGTWLAHLLVSGAAVLLLPRQFHVAVVENADEGHIRTAQWLFPAYLLVLNLFVLPLALGALALRGSPAGADTFVLTVPLAAGAAALSWAVFLGGFSAGTGMVIVETTALATMISNHLVVPAAGAFAPLAPLRRHVLPVRWVAALLVLLAAFAYERVFGAAYDLASLGFISFVAVLQLGPALLGGVFWRGASRAGALAGLVAGFATWVYTLVVPILARTGWLPARLLVEGPFGIEPLVPEGLFDVHADPVTHAVVWTLIANVSALVIGSLVWPASPREAARVTRLLDVLERPPAPPRDAGPGLARVEDKRAVAERVFGAYLPEREASALADAALARVGAREGGALGAAQLAELQAEVEATLASAIGAAAAHAAVRRAHLVAPEESRAVALAYADILAELNVPPEELRRMIDYHRERERLLARDAANQRFLAGVSGLLAGSLDLEATVRTAVRLPIPHLADAALLALRSDSAPRTCLAHVDPAREEEARAAVEGGGLPLDGVPSIARAFESGRPVTSRPRGKGWPDPLARVLPSAVEVTLPLVTVGEPLGALSLFGVAETRLSTPEEVALAEELARRLAIAVENARLFAEAEQAVRARDEFLAIASHELKTPLGPLRIRLQTLERLVATGRLGSVPPETLMRIFGGAEGQVLRLDGLINDLLDLTRIRAKRFRLDVAPMDLAAAVHDIVEQHRAEILAGGCTVSLDAPAPLHGSWDRRRIEQVVANLITNAVKYAPGSPIEVRVAPSDDGAAIVVRDHGPGIPPEEQERVFRPFERAAEARGAIGLGLGLYIVKQIVEAHGGTVRLESAPGQGATFTVQLPRAPPAQA